MNHLETQLEIALKKNEELIQKNDSLKRNNAILMRDLEKSRMENVKNNSLINELNIWVQNLTEVNSGNHEAFHKINQALFKSPTSKNSL